MKTVAIFYCFLFFRYTFSSTPSDCSEIKSVDDVYEYLWEQNEDIARTTLQLDFLMQMQDGTLQAERYTAFTIQDINYVLQVTNMLKEMSEKVKEPSDLKEFMQNRYLSYLKFSVSLLDQYSFQEVPPIKPTPAMEKYLSYYRNLMNNDDPVYFAVGLLPCARLWVWLANNIKTPPTNAYYTWKKENMDGHPEKHYKALLNKYLNTDDKVRQANDVFKTQMLNEHDFFSTS